MGPPKKKIKLSDNSGEHTGPDFSTLPYDVLMQIFKKLDFKTVSQCAKVCRTFYKISNESVIYHKVTFKYNMDRNLLENYISKVTRPRVLTVDYKFFESESDVEDYTEFDEYVTRFIKKSGEHLTSIHFESCRNEKILSLLSECPSVTDVSFYRCKGSFQSLPLLTNLTRVTISCCIIPNKTLQDALKNNPKLKTLSTDNSNLNVNDICKVMGKYNASVQELGFSEEKSVRAKGLKALARCCKLRILDLTGGPSDPEDSLTQLAAGCPLLESWKEVNDETLLPVLHSCIKLQKLDLRGIDITIKSCREAALSLPFLQSLVLHKCDRIKKTEIAKLQRDFQEIKITMS